MAEEKHHTEHIPKWKEDEIEQIKKLILSHKVLRSRSRRFVGTLKTLWWLKYPGTRSQSGL
jgi:hypothetical protein